MPSSSPGADRPDPSSPSVPDEGQEDWPWFTDAENLPRLLASWQTHAASRAAEDQSRVPSIGEVIGWMLGAHQTSAYATSSGFDLGPRQHEVFWVDQRYRYLAHAGVRATVCENGQTRDYLRGVLEDTAPREMEWMGWTDRLLTPRHLYIWGRRGEDWRLSGEVHWSTEHPGAVILPLVSTDEPRGPGYAVVEKGSGTVLVLRLGDTFEWRIDHCETGVLPPRPDPTARRPHFPSA